MIATDPVQTPRAEVPVDPQARPAHVAIIMDGNGRWARRHGLTRSDGHRQGARAVREVVTRARESAIPFLTLYAFSSQNWSRPQDEVERLMALLVEFCENERELLMRHEICFRIIGERARLPDYAREATEQLEAFTRDNRGMHLQVAVSYGGREELVHAVRRIAEAVDTGSLRPDAIDADVIQRHLWTAGIPDPDLVIRTSGELRVSNFLLWQIAYAEFFISDLCWPDFGATDFDRALAAFAARDRRFGGIGGDPAEDLP